MKETIVIIGSHPGTRGDYDWTREDADVWVFNEAFDAGWVADKSKVTATFQLHHPTIWRNPLNTNDLEHYQKLKSGNTPVVYMQEVYEDVPKSERYPLEQATAILESAGLPPYFTSTPAYAFALALIKGYKRIEVYGIEMATDTEYRYQRDGVALWMGIAVGRGVQVAYHTETYFKAPLYGYTADISIPRSEYERIKAEMLEKFTQLKAGYEAATSIVGIALEDFVEHPVGDPEPVQKAITACVQAAAEMGRVDGFIRECDRYIGKLDVMEAETGQSIIVRQEHERVTRALMQKLQEGSMQAHASGGRLSAAFDELVKTQNKGARKRRAGKFGDMLTDHMRLIVVGAIYGGALEQNQVWMSWLDQNIRAAGGQKAVDAFTGGGNAEG